MTGQTEQGVTLSESVDADKNLSPHWPKTLVSECQLDIQSQKPSNNSRRRSSALRLKLTKLRQFL